MKKIRKIEGKYCFFSYVRFYHHYLLELDGIHFHQTVLYFIKNQLVDLLNKELVCMEYREIMPVNVQPMRWLQSLLPALQMNELRFLSTLFQFIYIMLRLVHLITLKQSTNLWNWFHAETTEPTDNWVARRALHRSVIFFFSFCNFKYKFLNFSLVGQSIKCFIAP